MEERHHHPLGWGGLSPELGDDGVLWAPSDPYHLHRAPLILWFSSWIVLWAFQKGRYQPKVLTDGKKVSTTHSTHLPASERVHIIDSFFFFRNFGNIIELVARRITQIPQHHRLLFWRHSLLFIYGYLYFMTLWSSTLAPSEDWTDKRRN